MQSELEKKSLMQMAMGAIEERVDYEVQKVLDNILDVNTNPIGKRKITVVLELIPDSERQLIRVSAVAKSALVPTNPIATSLYITSDSMGEMAVVEMVPNIPGQISMDGGEQSQPKILKLPRRA